MTIYAIAIQAITIKVAELPLTPTGKTDMRAVLAILDGAQGSGASAMAEQASAAAERGCVHDAHMYTLCERSYSYGLYSYGLSSLWYPAWPI